MIDVPLPEEGGPPPTRAEHRRRQQEGYARIARDIVLVNVEVNPRRQDKIVAAIMRRDPSLILTDSVTLQPDERQQFLERAAPDSPNPITPDDYEAALSRTPIAVRIPTDDENLRRRMARFSGDETLQRRMRRVISATTHGDLDHPNDVDAAALLRFVTDRFPTAVAYEQHLPELVAMIENRKLGIRNYVDAIQAVGQELYGSQWTYLQQGRRAEEAGRRLAAAAAPDEPGPPRPPAPGAGAAEVEEVRRNSFETLVDGFPPPILLEPDPRVYDPGRMQQLADQRYQALAHCTDTIPDDRLPGVAREAEYARRGNQDPQTQDIRYAAAILDSVDPVMGVRLLHGLLQTVKRGEGGIGRVIDLPRLRELANTRAAQGTGRLNLNEHAGVPLRWANEAVNRIGGETGIQFVSRADQPWTLAALYVGIANEAQRRGVNTLTDSELAEIAQAFLVDTIIEQNEHMVTSVLINRLKASEQSQRAAEDDRAVAEAADDDPLRRKAREVLNRHLPEPLRRWRRRGRDDQ